MEKYSGWRDPGTGVHPFLHPQPQKRDQFLGLYLKYILGGPLAVLKLLVIIPLLLIVFVADVLAILLIEPHLKQLWRQVWYFVGFRLILGLCGCYWIPTRTAVAKRKQIQKQTVFDKTIYVANHSSYLDIFYLACWRAPVFLKVFEDGTVKEISVWQALLEFGLPLKKGSGQSLKQYLLTSSRPVAIFPEGTTSNNKGMLQFAPVFPSHVEDVKFNIFMYGFKYIYDEFCPAYTTGSRFGHLFKVLMQWYNTLDVVRIEIAKSRQAMIDSKEDVAGALQVEIGHHTRLRRIGKNLKDKESFLEFFKQKNQKS
ncbi:hypothetical protein EDD86DRAFT_191325 [Gorgonomyces haynaldii]|nr:hypothetical protein EDD86DRAFT_191325 [Gorgonomyces haynaldii]